MLKWAGEGTGALLPFALGYGYESLELVSHLRAEVSFGGSIENFLTHTNRYERTVEWGGAYCR